MGQTKLSNKTKALLGYALTPLVLSGCVSTNTIKAKPVAPHSYITINANDTVEDATLKLAQEYNLSLVHWAPNVRSELSNQRVPMPLKIDTTELNAQQAFDTLYRHTTDLTDVDVASGTVYVEPFEVSADQADYSVVKPKPKPKHVLNNTAIIQVANAPAKDDHALKSQKSSGFTTTSISKTPVQAPKTLPPKKASDAKVAEHKVSSPKQPSVALTPNTKFSEKKLAPEKTFFVNANRSYADNMRQVLEEAHYRIYRDTIDNSMATTLDEMPKANEYIHAKDILGYTSQMIDKINELNKKEYAVTDPGKAQNRIFALIDPKDKQVIFHQNGYAKNAAIFNVKKGRLSDNVAALAKQYGWHLNLKKNPFDTQTGWLASEDYNIGVSYPLVSGKSIGAALVKLTQSYPKLAPRLLESKHEVYIVDKTY